MKCMEIRTLKYYRSMATVQLIKELRNVAYHYHDWSCVNECHNYSKCKQNQKINEMRIREILSERPHIPNAREAKEIRRRRAKFGIKMNSAR